MTRDDSPRCPNCDLVIAEELASHGLCPVCTPVDVQALLLLKGTLGVLAEEFRTDFDVEVGGGDAGDSNDAVVPNDETVH